MKSLRMTTFSLSLDIIKYHHSFTGVMITYSSIETLAQRASLPTDALMHNTSQVAYRFNF